MARVKIGNVYPPDDYLMARCAPSGYGLGRENARLVDTPDDATNNGFYCVGNDAYTGDETTKDWRLGWCMLLVERRADTIYQTAKYLDIEWRRNKKNADTAWSPWEWVNPPMEIGVEYRTTERWKSKPVYRKLVTFNLTEATGGEIIVPHGISNFKGLVRQFAVLQDKFQLPYMYGGNTTWVSTVNDTNIIVSNTGLEWDSSYSWNFELYYTKTTD